MMCGNDVDRDGNDGVMCGNDDDRLGMTMMGLGRAAGGFMVWGKFAGKGRMEPSWEVLSGVG